MLNNEFRFIGTVVSEYEPIGTEQYPKYQLTIEVEKRRKGTPCTFKVNVWKDNFAVDVTKSVKGKLVIVTGYLDEYKGNVRLAMQDMIVVGAAPTDLDVGASAPIEDSKAEIDLPDDDLPF